MSVSPTATVSADAVGRLGHVLNELNIAVADYSRRHGQVGFLVRSAKITAERFVFEIEVLR